MQLTLFYSDGSVRKNFWAMDHLSPREEEMADDDEEALDDYLQDEDDLSRLREQDDDHLPDDDLQ